MANVKVSGSIEDTILTIYGYTCPQCRVELSNTKVFAYTISNKKGYFKFNKIIIPKVFSDLCLTSIDNQNNASNPTCIASPPPSKYKTDIGPILLAPSITTSSTKPQANSGFFTAGFAIPNSEVEIHLFKDKDKAPLYPKAASAYSLPILRTKSDANGYFALNLPTIYQSNYRLFATAQYQENYSYKSNTITYFMPTNKTFINYFFLLIPPLLLAIILLLLKHKKINPPRYLPMLYTKLWPRKIYS